MNSIDEIIQNRQSHFTSSFNGSKAKQTLIDRMLKNAHHAPSHKRTYPWRFVVFEEEGLSLLMDKLAEIYLTITPRDQIKVGKLEKFERNKTAVSHAIVVVVDYNQNANLPQYEEEAAVACAVQNMYLTISEEEKFGGYLSSGPLITSDEFSAFLSLKKDSKCFGIFYIGGLDQKNDPVERAGWKNHVSYFGDT